MKTSYIVLGTGVTALITAAILTIMMTNEAPPPQPAPTTATLSEDKLNRIEAELLKFRDENAKLTEENLALRKESEVLTSSLESPTTPTVKLTSSANKTTKSEPNSAIAATAPVELPQAPPITDVIHRVPGPDPTVDYDPQEAQLTDDQRSVLQLPMLAKINHYDKNFGVLAFDAGSGANVSVGRLLSVRRDSFLVCTIKVTEVHTNMSIAEIVSGTIPVGMQVKIGDQVVALKASSVSVTGRLDLGDSSLPHSEVGVTTGGKKWPVKDIANPNALTVPDAPTPPIGPVPTVTKDLPGAPPPPPSAPLTR